MPSGISEAFLLGLQIAFRNEPMIYQRNINVYCNIQKKKKNWQRTVIFHKNCNYFMSQMVIHDSGVIMTI